MRTVLLFILVDMVTMVPITGEKIIIRDKKIYEKIENLICKYSQNFYQSKRSIKKCNSTYFFFNEITGSLNFAPIFCQRYRLIKVRKQR